jgi:8-oxo-dGTP pyrophosphatase MutT (NUDIX family)
MQFPIHQFTDGLRLATVADQVGALPVRRRGGALEVLLVTSRETKRWVIPKGWPMDDLAPWDAARREAFEEAGVGGTIRRRPLGFYRYGKIKRHDIVLPCRVQVFRLAVEAQWAQWPEGHERSRLWLTLTEAAKRVAEPELKALILALR